MIEFLVGAFSVLASRANKIIKTLDVDILEKERGIPSSGLEQCRRVSQRTKRILDSIIGKQEILQQIKNAINAKKITTPQVANLLKQILKSYRASRREVDVIEENFVGHLVRFNEADIFFTQLATTLWKEANLPDASPIAVTNTSGYFCTWAALGIVFSPPSSERHLLIFPDLFHEFGHILHQGIKIKLFGKRFESELTTYIRELENKVRRTSRPIDKKTISEIAFRWINSWAEEVACDTFAIYTIGPAYGWCNLHLCLQSSNVFEKGSEHPADAARTKHIIRLLRRRGFLEDAEKIEKLWDQYLQLSHQTTTSYYQDFHPDGLFTAIMEDVEQALSDNNIRLVDKTPTIDILNQSWNQFLQNPVFYGEWEEKTIVELRKTHLNVI